MREERGQQPAKHDLAPGAVTLTVPSHPRYLYVIRSALYPLVIDAGFSKRETRKIVLAVDEACSNIIKYAYEGDHTKAIMMTVADAGDSFTITLRDYGRKADAAAIAPRDLTEIRPGGLGTRFMAMAFDTVRYEGAAGPGTLLTLEKKKRQQVKT
jgi:anti-sigma regulatory factor (Ser/Thr protein kinase)